MKKKILESNVIIIGAGLSGMISALSFANSNKKVTLICINNNKVVDLSDNRSIALTNNSLRFLKSILTNDIYKELENLIGVIKDIYVLDNKNSDKMVHFDSNEEDSLGSIIINAELKGLLWQQVNQHELIEVVKEQTIIKIEFGRELEDSVIHLINHSLLGKLIVLCAGSNCNIYKKYFSPKVLKNYSQSALTFNVTHEKNHESCAVEHFLPTGPFAILPLKNPFSSSIVWTVNKKMAAILKTMEIEDFEYYVQKNFGEFLGKIQLDGNINEFPLKAYLTNQYFYKNMALVADTAHIIHPLAGQGLNQGIKDIETLVKLSNNAYITYELLEKYQKLRKKDNMAMYLITDNLNRIFSNSNSLIGNLRSTGLGIIDKVYFIKKQLIKYASGER